MGSQHPSVVLPTAPGRDPPSRRPHGVSYVICARPASVGNLRLGPGGLRHGGPNVPCVRNVLEQNLGEIDSSGGRPSVHERSRGGNGDRLFDVAGRQSSHHIASLAPRHHHRVEVRSHPAWWTGAAGAHPQLLHRLTPCLHHLKRKGRNRSNLHKRAEFLFWNRGGRHASGDGAPFRREMGPG